MLSRRGAGFVRWRGALAFITDTASDPRDDALMASILDSLEEPWTSFFAHEWARGHADAAGAARELRACEPDMRHSRDAPGRCQRRHAELKAASTVGGRARQPAKRRTRTAMGSQRTLVRLFRWFGQLAYAQGIDRSPSHDVPAWKIVLAQRIEHQLPLVHAWQTGWDEAEDCADQLSLERRSSLEIPRVLDARPIHNAPPPGRSGS